MVVVVVVVVYPAPPSFPGKLRSNRRSNFGESGLGGLVDGGGNGNPLLDKYLSAICATLHTFAGTGVSEPNRLG